MALSTTSMSIATFRLLSVVNTLDFTTPLEHALENSVKK